MWGRSPVWYFLCLVRELLSAYVLEHPGSSQTKGRTRVESNCDTEVKVEVDEVGDGGEVRCASGVLDLEILHRF
jgi:hypothetical protein